MIVKIAVKTPTNAVLYKTYFGVTAQIDPSTHILQLYDRKKRLISEYPSGSYIFWNKRTMPQSPLTRAGRLLQHPHGTRTDVPQNEH
jgi:hypothetical protein